MPDVANYPLPKTSHKLVKCRSFGLGPKRDQALKTTPMMTPGPMKYEPKYSAITPQVKKVMRWAAAGTRDPRDPNSRPNVGPTSYGNLLPSTAPKWSVPKGRGHKSLSNLQCGSGKQYDVKKGYTDCEYLGDKVLLQSPAQNNGCRVKKVMSWRNGMKKTEPRPTNKGVRPGPGTYNPNFEATLDRRPNYSCPKVNLEKSRYTTAVALGKKWIPGPGSYNGDVVIKNNKVCMGGATQQLLGRVGSCATGLA